MDHVEDIRHALGRMVDIALQINERRLLLQHAVLIALLDRVDNRLLIGMALADVHIIADADDVRHKRDHVCGLADRLAVGDLTLALVQILHLQPQQVARRGKGESGAGGVVAEIGDTQTGIEDLCGDIALPEIAESVRDGKDCGDLVVGLVPCQEEIVFIHIVNAERSQFLGEFFCFAHFCSSA